MNMITKHQVLQVNLREWLACKGNKKKRGELINRFSKSLLIHKKSVGRSMRRLQLKDSSLPEKRGRSVYYGKNVDSAISKIWEEMEYPCAENMHSSIKDCLLYTSPSPRDR